MNRLTAVAIAILFVQTVIAQDNQGSPQAPGTEGARPATVAQVLAARVAEVSFLDAPFGQVVEWLAHLSGLNVWVRWQVLAAAGVEPDKPISFSTRNLRLGQLIAMVLTEAGGPGVELGFTASGAQIVISTRADLDRDMPVRVYDVADLLAGAARFEDAPRIDPAQLLQQLGSSGGGSAVQQVQDGEWPGPTRIDDLIAVIQTTIEPDSWVENGGRGSISAWRDKIIVRNTHRVHRLLGGFLDDHVAE
ncbi:MAG: hypothetical protein KKB50_02625 [Planctomycetes bacterium]|nr:hypothetical protein [Planctomycetota bacterium]